MVVYAVSMFCFFELMSTCLSVSHQLIKWCVCLCICVCLLVLFEAGIGIDMDAIAVLKFCNGVFTTKVYG